MCWGCFFFGFVRGVFPFLFVSLLLLYSSVCLLVGTSLVSADNLSSRMEFIMARIEAVVNYQADKGITLARIRSINGKAISATDNLPTLRLEQVAKDLTKGDGLLLEVETLTQKGNYLSAPNAKVLDKHVSGKSFDISGYMDALVEEAESTPF